VSSHPLSLSEARSADAGRWRCAASDRSAAREGVSEAASVPASPRLVAALGKFRWLISNHNYQGLGKCDLAGGWRCHEVESVSGVGQASQATGVERAGMGRDRRGGVCAAQQAFSASAPSGGICEARE